MNKAVTLEHDQSSERQAPRWKRRKHSRPEELLDAALTLFGEFGYAQTRLDDVAARAGISKGTVYLYFASKQDLFEAVIRERAAPWLHAMTVAEIDNEKTTEEVVREFMARGWSHFLESKLYLIARVVLAESNNFPHLAQVYLKEVMGPIHDQLLLVLERGIRRNEIRGEATRERAKALLAPLSWLALWKQALLAHSDPPVSVQAYVQESIEMVVQSLRRD